MSWITDSLRDFWERGDKLLLTLCLMASGYGLILIYSATRYLTVNQNRSVIIQAIGILLGVVVYIVLSSVDLELFTEKTWKFLFLFNIGFNLLVRTPLGVEEGGNRNWIRIPGLPINIHPAEIAKLTFILLFAYQCAKLREKGISKPSSVFQLLAHAGLMAGLVVVVSGDKGMPLVFLFLFAAMCLCAGVKLRWYALAGVIGTAGVAVLWPRVKDQYWAGRITVVIDHLLGVQETLYNQTHGAGWQQTRSVLAIGSGGFTGQGYLQGIQTQSPYRSSLPARSTDEIFAVCGEELGLVGCVLIILLLAAIIIRCVWVARRTPSPMTALTAMGYASMLLFQSVLNIGMCLYVLPIVGLTLPFFSYGGSSIITMFAAMGVVSSIKTRSLPSWLKDRNQ